MSEKHSKVNNCLCFVHRQFPLYHPINPEFRPNVDGRVIVDKPKQLFARGQFARVPFIIGTVRDEFGEYLVFMIHWRR